MFVLYTITWSNPSPINVRKCISLNIETNKSYDIYVWFRVRKQDKNSHCHINNGKTRENLKESKHQFSNKVETLESTNIFHSSMLLPNKLLFGELQHVKRSLGGQEKRFKGTLKAFDIKWIHHHGSKQLQTELSGGPLAFLYFAHALT